MQLRFLQGNPNAPKGHAILFARSSDRPQRVFATYCIVYPIPFSIGEFLPPILAAQMPAEGIHEAARMNFVPIPPMLEDAGTLEQLEKLAQLRGDDLCEVSASIRPEDKTTRFTLVAEAGEAYASLYTTYANVAIGEYEQAIQGEQISEVPLDDLDIDAVLNSVLSERDRLNELAKLIGTARYALDVKDSRLLSETEQKLRRTAEPLPAKYKAGELITAALEPGERGAKLAQLYLERGYKLIAEEYHEIPRIEREIRELTNNQG